MLTLIVIILSVWAFVSGIRGHPLVEAAFFLFYALTTIVIFVEVIREKEVTRNILIGIVCAYLLIGTAFATLFDLVETIRPGSFQFNTINAGDAPMRWRNLLYYSFTTLTPLVMVISLLQAHMPSRFLLLRGLSVFFLSPCLLPA